MEDYLSINEFPGSGAIMQVEINFAGNNPDIGSGALPYFKPENVKAEFFIPATSTTPSSTVAAELVLVNPNTFRTVLPVPVGTVLRVYRETEDRFPLVNFQALQNVTEDDLDALSRQVVFLVEEAKDAAEFAKSLADMATTNAATANVVANAARVVAEAASIASTQATGTANSAIQQANSAVALANSALEAAANAEEYARNVEELTAVAQEAAAQAALLAAAANSASQEAVATANGVDAKATEALDASTSALNSADSALRTANGVDAKANTALEDAANALQVANDAQATADGIAATANQAAADASAALTAANAANSKTTDQIVEGTTNLFYTGARVRASIVGPLGSASTAVGATDSLSTAISKLQNQNSAQDSAIDAVRGSIPSKNYIDNASFLINQRNTPTTGGNKPAGWYFYDRWKTSGAGSTNNAVTTIVGGNTSVADIMITITSGQICQVLAVDEMLGGTYTMVNRGTAPITLMRNGALAANAAGGEVVTFNISKAGLTDLTLYVGVGTLYQPQLVRSSSMPPFVPESKAVDLYQCQRFFARCYGLGMNSPYAGSTNAAMSYRFPWPVEMVRAPVITVVAPQHTTFQLSSWNADSATRSGFRLIMFSAGVGGYSLDFPVGDNLTNFIQGSCEP